MIDTLRRYWIGFLVLMLIGLHAGIVGMIRIQATQVKASQSCEVDLGSFYIAKKHSETNEPAGSVPSSYPRACTRQSSPSKPSTIELNIFQVRQAIEEHCRQADPTLLLDPLLVDLKTQLMDCMVQTVGETATEDIVITEVKPTKDLETIEFTAPSETQHVRKRMVITRQAKDEERKAEHDAAKSEGHGEEGEEKGGGHGKPKAPAIKHRTSLAR